MGQPKLQCSFLPFSLLGVGCEACLVPRASSKALPIAVVLSNLPWELHLTPERLSGKLRWQRPAAWQEGLRLPGAEAGGRAGDRNP